MIKVYFDGACWPRSPGGHIGWGFFVWERRNKQQYQDYGYGPPGRTTCNLAEYWAAHEAVVYLLRQGLERKRIIIYGDSKLVVKQMNGKWKIHEGVYESVARTTYELVQQFEQLKFQWVPRANNSYADYLSRLGLQKGGVICHAIDPRIKDLVADPNTPAFRKRFSQCLNQLQSSQTLKESSNLKTNV